MKVLTVVGARPQFIKAATVSRVLREHDEIDECLVHTGQHYDANMSDIFFSELEIPHPKYNLGVIAHRHGEMTGLMLTKLEHVLIDEDPDVCLIYGDTNSTVAAALASAKLRIPVAHVEAGLRSFNRAMPEEINRVMSDHLSDILFAPTVNSVSHLLREGIPNSKIFQVGDVMYDASIYYGLKSQQHSRVIKDLGCDSGEYVLVTIHRQENTNDVDRLGVLCNAVEAISRNRQVVLPLHPRTKKQLEQFGLHLTGKRLVLTEPVGYLDMIQLERNAAIILTDSGGVQKEAYFYRIPCVTLRKETEWTELVETGWNRLGGDSAIEIIEATEKAIGSAGKDAQPYGSGRAAEEIYSVLKNFKNSK